MIHLAKWLYKGAVSDPMNVLIKVLKALSDPNRVRIMKMLQMREMCVCELAEALGITQPSVSRHMRILTEAELVSSRREGPWIHYLWNPSPSNPYAATLLAQLRGWLEEDPGILSLMERASALRREEICKAPSRERVPSRGKELAHAERTK
jgi:ArsR family transcriptional regulator